MHGLMERRKGGIQPLPVLLTGTLVWCTIDADPGPQDPCVVAEMRQIHTDYQVLWRKRDCTATLSRGECLDPCLDRLLLLFWAHYIEDDPH